LLQLIQWKKAALGVCSSGRGAAAHMRQAAAQFRSKSENRRQQLQAAEIGALYARDHGREICGGRYIGAARCELALHTGFVIWSCHSEPSSQSSAMQSLDTHVADLA
jgi:hypothetical protein